MGLVTWWSCRGWLHVVYCFLRSCLVSPVLLLLLLLLVFSSGAAQNATASPAEEFHVGVILDLGSLVGKVALTSVSLAVEDFYAACQNCSRKLVLHVRDSMGNDVQAASAGMCSVASHVL